MATWQQLILGAMAILIALWFSPGIKAIWEKSKRAPKDWGGVLLPVGLVVALVVFLAMTL